MAYLRLLLYVTWTLTILIGSEALTTETIKPIRATGDEVGLIFIPGSFMELDQYRKTAQAIQAASDLRVWVALTGQYYSKLANAKQLRLVVNQAISALENAGMVSKNFVGVGHGIGGNFLQMYATKPSQLKAIVLLGAALSRDMSFLEYPLPVLTLAAELDGITQITRIAHEYGKLKEALKTNSFALHTNPIIVIDGANHRQFASGNFQKDVVRQDLPPEISEDEEHGRVGKHVGDFLTATFVTKSDKKNNAVAELEKAFSHTNKTLQPFLDMRDLVKKGDFSQWTVLAQERLAEEFASQVEIVNKVAQNTVEFYRADPSVKIEDGLVKVETSALLVHGPDQEYYGLPSTERAVEIDMKLNTKVAISAAVATTGNYTGVTSPRKSLIKEPVTCRTLNELALNTALAQSSSAAQQRYRTQGRPIVFEDDVVRGFYPFWVTTPLEKWEDDGGLHVKAIARVVFDKGEHYCKVISPFFAMEWIHVDSLRKL